MAAFPEPEAFEKMDLDEHEPIQMNSGATTEEFQSHLTIAADDAAAKSAEIERLTQELAQSRLEMELLQKRSRDMSEDSELDTFCHINIANKDELEKAELEIQNLRIVNEKLKSEQNRLTGELLTNSAKIVELKEESEKTRKKSEYDLAEAKTKIQRQTEEIGKLINELGDFKRIINNVEEKLNDSNRQMQLSKQRHEDEIQKYSNLVRERDATEKKLDEYSADLEKQLGDFKRIINNVEEKLNDSNRQMQLSKQRHEDEIQKYSNQVRERDATVKELDEYSAHLETQLIGIKKKLDLSENKVADFQLKKECHEREVEDYKSMLEKYMAEVHSQTGTIRLIQEANIAQSRSLTSLHEEVARLNLDKEKILFKNDEFQKKLKLKQDELEKTKTNKNTPIIDNFKRELHLNKETLNNERKKWNAEKTQFEQMCSSAKEETNRISHAFNTVNQECIAVKETLRKTLEERDELTMRLSKLASASLTHNNPNIADLSDPNRPTKLSEAFSELYDNEWTDAFECIKAIDERITVSSLLEMLQKAYEFSITLTNQASTNMSGTFTDLSLKYNRGSKDMVTQNSLSRHARIEYTTEQKDMSETSIDDKSKERPNYANNVKSDWDTIGETGISLLLNEKTLESNTILMKDSKHHEVTAEQTLPVVKSKTDMTYPTSVCTQDDELHSKDTIQTMPAYVDMAIQVNVDELEAGTCVATVSFDLDKLNPTEKQTITYIRKRVLHDLKDQIIPMIANAVGAELNLHACDDSIFTYVKTCASICWEMRIHQPPVCLDFKEVDDETLFNTATYKHYTKAGLRMDYVVWPAMYLYEGGPLLSKGVAQGK